MKKYFIPFIVTCVIFASCGGNVVSYSAEDVKEEVARTDKVLADIDDCLAQMKATYDETAMTKLSDLVDEMGFFGFTEEFEVPETETDKVQRQLTKIEKAEAEAKELMKEYETLCEYLKETQEALSETEAAYSDFMSNGFERTSYDKTKAAAAKIDLKDLRFSVPALQEKYDAVSIEAKAKYKELTTSLTANEKNIRISLMSNSELLLESNTTYPYYLHKGDNLYIGCSTNNAVEFKIWDVNSKKLLKSIPKKKKFNEVISIPNTSIYLVEAVVPTSTYFDINISKSTAPEYWDENRKIKSETVECQKGDFMSYPITTINTVNLFQEPRKITLRSGFKAIFSGSTSSSVALNIPAGTTDIAYQLRISTSKGAKARDGQFCDEITTRTKTVKIMGKTVVEIQKQSSNLIREVLNEINKPEIEEEAYCSMYVFYDAASAKKFQEGKPASSLKYDVNYSIVGTQSTNGAIPAKSSTKNIYLAFANDRAGANVYIWLEAVATVNVVTYWRTIYTLE